MADYKNPSKEEDDNTTDPDSDIPESPGKTITGEEEQKEERVESAPMVEGAVCAPMNEGDVFGSMVKGDVSGCEEADKVKMRPIDSHPGLNPPVTGKVNNDLPIPYSSPSISCENLSVRSKDPNSKPAGAEISSTKKMSKISPGSEREGFKQGDNPISGQNPESIPEKLIGLGSVPNPWKCTEFKIKTDDLANERFAERNSNWIQQPARSRPDICVFCLNENYIQQRAILDRAGHLCHRHRIQMEGSDHQDLQSQGSLASVTSVKGPDALLKKGTEDKLSQSSTSEPKEQANESSASGYCWCMKKINKDEEASRKQSISTPARSRRNYKMWNSRASEPTSHQSKTHHSEKKVKFSASKCDNTKEILDVFGDWSSCWSSDPLSYLHMKGFLQKKKIPVSEPSHKSKIYQQDCWVKPKEQSLEPVTSAEEPDLTDLLEKKEEKSSQLPKEKPIEQETDSNYNSSTQENNDTVTFEEAEDGKQSIDSNPKPSNSACNQDFGQKEQSSTSEAMKTPQQDSLPESREEIKDSSSTLTENPIENKEECAESRVKLDTNNNVLSDFDKMNKDPENTEEVLHELRKSVENLMEIRGQKGASTCPLSLAFTDESLDTLDTDLTNTSEKSEGHSESNNDNVNPETVEEQVAGNAPYDGEISNQENESDASFEKDA